MKYKFFTEKEVEGLDHAFVEKLDKARELSQVPFKITSGRRTLLANEQVPGAVRDSAHLDGLAVDLLCTESWKRFKIVKALIEVGFCRIGIYEKHIHADASLTLPQNVMWYANTN